MCVTGITIEFNVLSNLFPPSSFPYYRVMMLTLYHIIIAIRDDVIIINKINNFIFENEYIYF